MSVLLFSIILTSNILPESALDPNFCAKKICNFYIGTDLSFFIHKLFLAHMVKNMNGMNEIWFTLHHNKTKNISQKNYEKKSTNYFNG